MSRIDSMWAGLALGLLMGAAHGVWLVLVATGAAAWVVNLVFRLHFIRLPFEIDRFDPTLAALLIGYTTLSGLGLGWLFATFWNGLARVRASLARRRVRR